jgi:hypothetical protein
MLQKVFATKILGTSIGGTQNIGGIHRLDSKTSMASCSNSTIGGDKCSSVTTIVMESGRLEKKGSVCSNDGSCSSDSLEQIGNKRPPIDYCELIRYFPFFWKGRGSNVMKKKRMMMSKKKRIKIMRMKKRMIKKRRLKKMMMRKKEEEDDENGEEEEEKDVERS